MCRSLILSALLAFLSICIPFTTATLRLQSLFAEINSPAVTLDAQQPEFDFDLQSALPPASSTLSELSVLPGDCAAYVGPDNECKSTMTAVNATFNDCGDPFTVCRCDNATMSMDTILDRFGRVPVGLRRYVGTVIVLGDTEPHAYTLTTGETHFFGDCAMDTWIHEASHSFDFASAHSSDPGWAQALASDTCVPDSYSRTNQIEAFAQMSVMKIYTLLYNGHLPPGFRADCMAHQLDFMAALPFYNATSLFGNTCAIFDGLSGARFVPLLHININGQVLTQFIRSHNIPPAVLDPTRAFKTVSLSFAPAIRTALTPSRDDVPDATSGLSPQANGFDFDLEDALPPAFSTLTQIVALPTECAAHVGPDLECTSGMLAMSVVFEDCGDAFTVCRCDDAAMTVDTILDRFGRLPVGLRRYAGTVIVLNDGAPHAYTLATGETQYFGDCNLNTWIHETMHAYDFFPGESQSSSADWSAAIQSDSCVPDSYSLTNQVEDFAQMGVMTTYMLLHDGQLPPGFDPNCMSNQFNFMAALPLFNPQSLFGNTCAIQDAPLARSALKAPPWSQW
ncbi:hypothetical protein C8J57DRAFT_1060162 [Mycena rebaudengoi]|nr:hypothetical protein C8J57DRAFT_1060162 [Mycena rebaudengoi]